MPWDDPRARGLPGPKQAGVNGINLLRNKSSLNLLPAGHYVLFAVKGWHLGGVSWLILQSVFDSPSA